MRQLTVHIEKCEQGRKSCHYECMAACADKVLKLSDPSKAGLQIRQMADGRASVAVCDQCGDCIVICPVDALKRNKLGVIMIDKQLCVGCDNCTGICDKGVLMNSAGRPTPHKCVACGICAKACPHGALELVVR